MRFNTPSDVPNLKAGMETISSTYRANIVLILGQSTYRYAQDIVKVTGGTIDEMNSALTTLHAFGIVEIDTATEIRPLYSLTETGRWIYEALQDGVFNQVAEECGARVRHNRTLEKVTDEQHVLALIEEHYGNASDEVKRRLYRLGIGAIGYSVAMFLEGMRKSFYRSGESSASSDPQV